MTTPAGSGTRAPRLRSELLLLLVWYLAGLVAVVVGVILLLATRGAPVPEILSRFPRLLRWVLPDPLTHVLALAPYVLFLLGRSLRRAYRAGGPRGLALALLLRVVLPAGVVAGAGLAYRAYREEGPVAWHLDPATENHTGRTRGLGDRDGKIRGVNLVAGRRHGPAMLEPLLRDNVEWISVSPFGWQERLDGTVIVVHPDAGFWTERDSSIVDLAAMARGRGMKMMLKPQLWIMNGSGGTRLAEVGPSTEEGWREWFDSYRAFLLHYARLAERARVDLLCVGAELKRSTTTHPAEWRALIAAAREVYHGRLTYAANWEDEAREIPFWDALDLIGIQAYYPLCTQRSPDLATLRQGWGPVEAALDSLHTRWGKAILFTEVGWKSTADAAIRPWEWTEDGSQILTRVSTRVQADAYRSFFDTIWREPWFGGAFIWKWYGNHTSAGGRGDIDFTPQNKPAEAVLARGFAGG